MKIEKLKLPFCIIYLVSTQFLVEKWFSSNSNKIFEHRPTKEAKIIVIHPYHYTQKVTCYF